MRRHVSRTGFTLTEGFVLGIIIAVVAATIVPQFAQSADEAIENTLKLDQRMMRAQIERYKFEHHGAYPTLAQFAAQLTGKTAPDGRPNVDGELGPYLDQVPPNPYDRSNAVSAAATSPPVADNGKGGWQYDETSGDIWPNHAGWKP